MEQPSKDLSNLENIVDMLVVVILIHLHTHEQITDYDEIFVDDDGYPD